MELKNFHLLLLFSVHLITVMYITIKQLSSGLRYSLIQSLKFFNRIMELRFSNSIIISIHLYFQIIQMYFHGLFLLQERKLWKFFIMFLLKELRVMELTPMMYNKTRKHHQNHYKKQLVDFKIKELVIIYMINSMFQSNLMWLNKSYSLLVK